VSLNAKIGIVKTF